MKLWKLLTIAVVLFFGVLACRDMYLTNPNEPDRERALAQGADVETLIRWSLVDWWWTSHGTYPAAPFSSGADAASWGYGSFGMGPFGREPRIPFDNSPEYVRRSTNLSPWRDSYQGLAAVRDGFLAIQDGVRITDGDEDHTARALAFGQLTQAMNLSNLAVVFDQAFVVDENTNLDSLELVPYQEVWAAALEKYAAAIATAQSHDFTIPAPWVGNKAPWTRDDFIGLARAFRARYRTQIPRTVSDRASVNWSAVLADLSAGLPLEFVGHHDPEIPDGGGWWCRNKLHSGTFWATTDYRTVGPSDVSGAWEAWINAPPEEKLPFKILSPDSRIHAPGDPTAEGKYYRQDRGARSPARWGTYHWSDYMDTRWIHFFEQEREFVGDYPDFVHKEVDFLRGEAWYRLGDVDKAREIVNQYRANGDLPPFTGMQNPDGPDSCVPQMPDGSCGDLWEAFKYEKRIELYHYSFGTEYFDDRGWGDLVVGTPIHLPIPGEELLLMLEEIYTFGGDAGGAAPGGGSTPDLMNDVSPDAIHWKVVAYQRHREATAETIEPGGIG